MFIVQQINQERRVDFHAVVEAEQATLKHNRRVEDNLALKQLYEKDPRGSNHECHSG